MNRFKLRVWDPMLNKGAIWTYWEGAYRDTGTRRRGDAGHPDRQQEGLVLVHPAARQHRQRRRRRAVRLPVQGPRTATSRPTTKKSRLSRRQRARREGASASTGYFATKDYSYRVEAGGGRWLGARRRRLWLPRPAVFVGRAAGAEIGRAGRRCHRRGLAKATRRRHSSASGGRFQRRRRSHAPPGLRILRRLQLRQVGRRYPDCEARSPTC